MRKTVWLSLGTLATLIGFSMGACTTSSDTSGGDAGAPDGEAPGDGQASDTSVGTDGQPPADGQTSDSGQDGSAPVDGGTNDATTTDGAAGDAHADVQVDAAPDASSDASSDAGLDAGQDAATACGAPSAIVAPLVAETATTSAVPTFTGGTFVDGTYYLTDLTDYGAADAGATGDTERLIWVVSNSASGSPTVLAAQIRNGGTDQSFALTFSPTDASATAVLLNLTCPSATSLGLEAYTVTTGSPVQVIIQGQGSQVQTFTKQ